MAEGFLKSIDQSLTIVSAGTYPEKEVNSYAVKVMRDVGIDISLNHPKSVNNFMNEPFDFVITVCDHAKEVCPIFTGQVNHRLHIGFDDPAAATGTDEEILMVYRTIRDQIMSEFTKFYNSYLTN